MTEDSKAALRRRRSQRYGKNGIVHVRLAMSGPTLTGSLFDIGIGGCLVWMDTDFPFNSNDIVEIRLTCDALSLRVLGAVRHTSDEARTLGIEFHRLNPKLSAELADFLEKLEASAGPATT